VAADRKAGTLAGFCDGREDMVFPEERQTQSASVHHGTHHSSGSG
jgi:hypothetical protein